MKEIGRWFYAVTCPIITASMGFVVLNQGIKTIDTDFVKFMAGIGFCILFIFQAIVAFIYANNDVKRINNND